MRLFSLSAFLILSLAFNSCKKDYPGNIPNWLKNEITQLKRTGTCTRGTGQACIGGTGIWIDQCRETTSGNTLYRFGSIDPTTYFYYTIDGQYIGYTDSWANTQQIGPYLAANINFIRKIWTAQGCQ